MSAPSTPVGIERATVVSTAMAVLSPPPSVTSPQPGGPADKGPEGLQANDVLVEAEGQNIEMWPREQVVRLIRSVKDELHLTVRRLVPVDDAAAAPAPAPATPSRSLLSPSPSTSPSRLRPETPLSPLISPLSPGAPLSPGGSLNLKIVLENGHYRTVRYFPETTAKVDIYILCCCFAPSHRLVFLFWFAGYYPAAWREADVLVTAVLRSRHQGSWLDGYCRPDCPPC